MNAAETHMRAGRVSRDPVAIVKDLQAGALSLVDQFKFWSALLPRAGSISAAQATAAGIERTLQELRGAMRDLDAPPPPQRAA